MNVISCPTALIGCNPQNFNLSKEDKDCVVFPCDELHVVFNKAQKTYGVFDNETNELRAIGYDGHGCVIFDYLYFGRDELTIVETIYRLNH